MTSMRLVRSAASASPSSPVHSWQLRKNVTVMSAAYGVGALTGFASQVVIVRRVDHPLFGTYISAFALVTIVCFLFEFVGPAWFVRDAAWRARIDLKVLRGVLRWRTCIGCVVVASSALCAWLLGFGGTGILVVLILAVTSSANAMLTSLRAVFQAVERLEVSAALTAANALVSAAGVIGLLQLGWGLLWALALSAGVSVALLPVAWLLLGPLRPTLRGAQAALRSIAWRSLPFGLVSAFVYGLTYADVLVVKLVAGTQMAGLYGAANRLVVVVQWVPALLLESTLRSLAHLGRSAPERFSELVHRTAGWLLALAAPIAVGGIVLAQPIVTLILGRSYASAASPLRVLLLALPAAFPAWILLEALVVRRPWVAARVLAVIVVLNLGADCVAVPAAGAAGAAWVWLASQVLLLVSTSWLLRSNGVTTRWMRSLFLAVPGCAVMVLPVLALRTLPLPVPVAAGAAAYVCVTLGLHSAGRVLDRRTRVRGGDRCVVPAAAPARAAAGVVRSHAGTGG